MKVKQIVLFSLLSISFYSTATCPNPIIYVYTTQNYPIKNKVLAQQIYFLDSVERWEDEISRQIGISDLLPSQAAEDKAKQYFQSQQWKQAEYQLKQATNGIIQGWRHGIKKIPAILFIDENQDEQVIYGETDVAIAKQEWQRWDANRGKNESK